MRNMRFCTVSPAIIIPASHMNWQKGRLAFRPDWGHFASAWLIVENQILMHWNPKLMIITTYTCCNLTHWMRSVLIESWLWQQIWIWDLCLNYPAFLLVSTGHYPFFSITVQSLSPAPLLLGDRQKRTLTLAQLPASNAIKLQAFWMGRIESAGGCHRLNFVSRGKDKCAGVGVFGAWVGSCETRVEQQEIEGSEDEEWNRMRGWGCRTGGG